MDETFENEIFDDAADHPGSLAGVTYDPWDNIRPEMKADRDKWRAAARAATEVAVTVKAERDSLRAEFATAKDELLKRMEGQADLRAQVKAANERAEKAETRADGIAALLNSAVERLHEMASDVHNLRANLEAARLRAESGQ